MRLINWLFWQLQKRCVHDGPDVAADILEGGANYRVLWCRRCGAYAINYSTTGFHATTWRQPRATWTGPGR